MKAGDLLLRFDLEKIMAEGYDPVTIAVVTNQEKYSLKVENLQQVQHEDTLMLISAAAE